MKKLLINKRKALFIINAAVIFSVLFAYIIIVQAKKQQSREGVLGAIACGQNTIGGVVFEDLDSDGTKDANEPGIQGISVSVYKASGKIGTATTDDTGSYVMNVPKGTQIRVEFSTVTPNMVYYPGPHGSDSHTSVYFLTANGNCNIHFGVVRLGFSNTIEVGNRVWFDKNKNGLQDPDEPGISGVTVRLYKDGSNTPIATIKTNNSGEYYFKNGGLQQNGSYTVRLDNPDDYTTGPLKEYDLADANKGSSDLIDSDAKKSGGYPRITFDVGICDLCNHNNDFGFIAKPVATATPSPSPMPTESATSSPETTPTSTPRPTYTLPRTTTSPSAQSTTPTISPTTTNTSESESKPTGIGTLSIPSISPTVTPTPSSGVLGTEVRLPRELPNTGIVANTFVSPGVLTSIFFISNGFLLRRSKRKIKIRFKKDVRVEKK